MINQTSANGKPNSHNTRHILVMCLIMLVVATGMAYFFLHVDLIPNAASRERGLIDEFVKTLFAIASVFFVMIMTVIIYALIFFRRRRGDETPAGSTSGQVVLEMTWTIVPLIIVAILSFFGARALDQLTAPNPPQSAAAISENVSSQDLVVNVTAARFIWEFSYPDYGINTSYVLEVPVNRRIRFNIQSKDVIHSFWVQQWGPKQDAVPGLTEHLYITPTKTGDFLVQCDQLCGYGHSNMTAPVKVVSEKDFETWALQQGSATVAPKAPSGTQVLIDLTAKNIAFNKKTITVPAGANVTIDFHNQDNGIPHNFSVYTNSSATKAIFNGKIITGPGEIKYTFKAPDTPGNYFFRCDVHPTIMTGTFVVK